MKKISKEGWLLAGMDALFEKGGSALRIDQLCKKLKVSKGSFYHHFKNLDDYIEELMQFWERENTLAIIEEVEKTPSFKQKVEKLNELVLEKQQQVEVNIRAWSANDLRIKKYIDKIDSLRLNYLHNLYKEYGIADDKTLSYARIEYCAFIGMQHLLRHLPKKELQQISNLFQNLIKSKLP